jgi:F-type H+-transporting ATPase subunit a
MQISPDITVLWQWGVIELNATILFTWIVMAIMVIGSWLVTRRLSSDVHISRWQNAFESVVSLLQQQLKDVTRREPLRFLPLIGTLFLFIAVSNILTIIPGFRSPAGSLSTTTGLSLVVFLAVPIYSVSEIGLGNYLRNYLRPTFFMLPFNIMGEFTRTLALAVRLFGNVMSGTMIGAILLAIAPLIFPVIMQLLGLLTGLVQAYIFAILAAVYIAAGMEIEKKQEQKN